MERKTNYVRITRSEYNKKHNLLKLVKEFSIDSTNTKTALKFFNQGQFPTIEDLIVHDVENNMDKYYWHLMYYKFDDLFQSDDPEFKKSKKMIDSLFKKYMIIIEDEDIDKLKEIKGEEWKKIPYDQKRDLLEPLSLYFSDIEKEEFANYILDNKIIDKADESVKKELEKIFISYY